MFYWIISQITRRKGGRQRRTSSGHWSLVRNSNTGLDVRSKNAHYYTKSQLYFRRLYLLSWEESLFSVASKQAKCHIFMSLPTNKQLRTELFCLITLLVVDPEDGTEGMSRKVGNKLPLLDV